MKKILLSIVALCCTVVAGAQNSSQIVSAILQTGDVTTIYYGQDALKNAYNAAVNGSVITLTSGLFNPPTDSNIQKSISIYGAGFEDNSAPGVVRTSIWGGINFLADTDGNPLYDVRLEGVFVNGNINVRDVQNLIIAKCYMGTLYFTETGVSGLEVRQSRINGDINLNNKLIGGLSVKNCHISGFVKYLLAGSQVSLDHCILSARNTYDWDHAAVFYTNCIFRDNGGVHANAYLERNVFVEIGGISNVTSIDNWFSVNLSTLFADGFTNMDYNESRTFELADPNEYKGTDGTPVGVTGGEYPWYKVPSIPYVKNLNATVEGTNLKVNYVAGVGSTNPQP